MFHKKAYFIGSRGLEAEGDGILLPLRFGIAALDFQSTADLIMVNGIPDFSRFNVESVVRTAVMEGYSVIELAMDAKYIIPGSLSPEAFNRLLELRAELGHSYTIHLPFWSIELATFNKPVREGSIKSIVECIKLAEVLEPEAYVLHTTGDLAENFSTLPLSKELVQVICRLLTGFSAESVEDIITKTEIDPRKLAIENCAFPFEIMYDVIDDQDTGICFDTAHLITRMSGTESVMEFYRTHSDRIIEVHLQDGTYSEYRGVLSREDHIPLGQGMMGDNILREFLTELVSDKFPGPIIFELSRTGAKESLTKIRNVVPEVLE